MPLVVVAMHGSSHLAACSSIGCGRVVTVPIAVPEKGHLARR